MSNRFHINSVKVTGPGVRDSEVQFQEGLNIIEGGSGPRIKSVQVK